MDILRENVKFFKMKKKMFYVFLEVKKNYFL